MGRPELTRLYAAAIAAGRRTRARARRRTMLHRRDQANRGKDFQLSATRSASALSRRMPAGRDHPRRHAGRSRSDRRRGVRRWHSNHRGAAEFARSAQEHRKAGATASATGRWSAPAPCSSPGQVADVRAAGGRLIVSPNTNLDVIARDRRPQGWCRCPAISRRQRHSRRSMPARTALKLFPAEGASPAVLKAQLAVIPKDVPIFVVGGVSPDNMRPWLEAGAIRLRARLGPLQARPVGRRDRRQRRAPTSPDCRREADPDRHHRLRQDRRGPARPSIAGNPRFELVATSSRSGQGVARTFTDWRELIRSVEGLEAVAITTPPGPRYEIARECIARRPSLPA